MCPNSKVMKNTVAVNVRSSPKLNKKIVSQSKVLVLLIFLFFTIDIVDRHLKHENFSRILMEHVR